MPVPRVLSVGQCALDHANLTRHLRQNFDARVTGAETFDDALAALRSEEGFDLVLVNRVADADGAPGLELIRTLKADPALSRVPVMLVSDLAGAQEDAVALGALPGFGKSGLRQGETVRLLATALGADRS